VKHDILIVEDNPLNGELLSDWLEVEGYAVRVSADLQSAFAAVRSRPPDAVLLDVQLDGEDGLLLASWMRQEANLSKIPVIAVTAQAMASERQHILASGCKSVVHKPVDFAVLKQQLQLWLSSADATQERREADGK